MKITRKSSTFGFRPRVMLVRMEPPSNQQWGLDDLGVEILRVRHPLPACARMAVTRPFLVIVGQEVRSIDVAFVKRAAREIGAKVVQLGALTPGSALRRWVEWALDEAVEAAAAR